MRLLYSLSAAALLVPTLAIAEPADPLSGFATSGDALVQTRFYYWDEDGSSDNGIQIVTPLTLSGAVEGEALLFEISGRLALIHSSADQGNSSGSVTTLSDTVISGTATYADDQLPFYPFITASINLPSGKETLSGDEKAAVADIDVVEQTRFGEGVNLNLGAGVTIPISEALSGTVAGSYNIRGNYVPDGDSGDDFEPGDQITVYAEIQYQNPTSSISLGAKYNREEKSRLAGTDYFDPGDSYELYGRIAKALTQLDTVNLSFSAAQYTKNETFDPFSGSFRTDDERSAGNVYRVNASYTRAMPFGSLGLAGEVLFRDRNDFDEISDRFVPSRIRFLFGPTAQIAINEATTLDLRAQYVRLEEDEFPVTGLERSFNGAQASATMSYRF